MSRLRVSAVIGAALPLALALTGCHAVPKTGAVPLSPPPSLSKTFSSRELGVTFRYPRGWREVASASGGNRTGDGVTFLGASGAVQVGVNYDNHYAFDGSVAPRPFTGASEADEHRLLSVISPPKLFLTKLTRVGGLRVVEVEYSQELPQGAPIAGDVREIEVASAWVGDSRSQVHLAVFCRTEHWAASRATFLAILETVSFSRPAGLG